MTKQHTPGPWEFDEDANEITTPNRIKNDQVCIAIVELGWDEPFESEQQANARLIAAAPDLLQELRNIADANTSQWDDKSDFEAWAKSRARAAIAKATGAA